jgi:sugar O-acyltransferase (sialic acid O-acetyltransferase NeuD family)
MKNKTWTILGAGNFIYDILDAINSNHGETRCIVLNQAIDRKVLGKVPGRIKVLEIAAFRPMTDFYFFGFVDPNKEPFLEAVKPHNLIYPNLVHHFSYLADGVEMGEGNFIGAGVVIAPNVKFGNFNFVNRSASVGHDTKISNFNHLGPGCTVAGQCKIGNKNFLGAGSTVIESIQIKDQITIGAGGVVTKNISEIGTYAGVPVQKLNQPS